MRGARPSSTALSVAAFRAFHAAARGVDDNIDAALLPAPWRHAVGLIAPLFAARPASTRWLARATLGLSDNVALRTLRIDEVASGAVARGVDQVVLLGAGFDARAYRLAGLARAHVFEVDHPSTQHEKRVVLGDRVPLAREVMFVGVDFERDAIDASLRRAGFDPSRRSVWVWEGVTMYLTPEARRTTLDTVSSIAARGSVLLVTYIQPSDVASAARRVVIASGRVAGETVRGLVDQATLSRELAVRGWQVREDDTMSAWAARYRPARRLTNSAWEHLVTAEKSPTSRADP